MLIASLTGTWDRFLKPTIYLHTLLDMEAILTFDWVII